MPPSRFCQPQLNGVVTVRRFKAPRLETEAIIKKGELREPLNDVAARIGLQPAPAAGALNSVLSLVDDQEMPLMGKLIAQGVYYMTGGTCVDEGGAAGPSLDAYQRVDGAASTPAAASHAPDTAVGWAFDPRVLLHRSLVNCSPETPHRLQRAVEVLQRSVRAREILPPELLVPFIAHLDGTLERDMAREAPSVADTNRALWIPPRLATCEEICSFQDAAVFSRFVEYGTALADLKSDVYCCEEASSLAVRLSAGGVIDACAAALQAVVACRSQDDCTASTTAVPLVSFCLVRPPGHHCTASCPSGFCLINNVAVAVQQLRMRHASVLARGTPRIAVVDLDVHFGEGTASYVEDVADPASLLYLSLHRYDAQQFYPFDARGDSGYPGGGPTAAAERSICNVGVHTHASLPERCEEVISDRLMNLVLAKIFLPRLAALNPDLVIVSLGFDAAYGDPLGKMAVEGGFASVLSRLKRWCTQEGRTVGLVVVLEGGYNPEAMAQGVLSVALALSLPVTDPDVEAFAQERCPRVWGDLRQRQARRLREWVRLQQENMEKGTTGPVRAAEGAPEQVEDDALLLQRHQKWCDAVVTKVCELHRGIGLV